MAANGGRAIAGQELRVRRLHVPRGRREGGGRARRQGHRGLRDEDGLGEARPHPAAPHLRAAEPLEVHVTAGAERVALQLPDEQKGGH